MTIEEMLDEWEQTKSIPLAYDICEKLYQEKEDAVGSN